MIYRFSIKTDNVYKFCCCNHVSTLASYRQEVSGFIKKENLWKLNNELLKFGYSFNDKNIKLITSDRYFKDMDKYTN